MTKRHFDRVCDAVWNFAEERGMRPRRVLRKDLASGRFLVELAACYCADPGVPDVHSIQWRVENPSIISGFNTLYGLQGSWTDFICPREELACTP